MFSRGKERDQWHEMGYCLHLFGFVSVFLLGLRPWWYVIAKLQNKSRQVQPSQLAFSCSNSTMEIPGKCVILLKVYNRGTITTSKTSFLIVSFILNFEHILTDLSAFIFNFEQILLIFLVLSLLILNK